MGGITQLHWRSLRSSSGKIHFFSFLGVGWGAKRLFLCILSDLGKNSTHEDSTFIYLGILYFICEQSTGVER